MSNLRKRYNRFTPIEEIEWLDTDQRTSHRDTIKVLTDLTVALEKGQELTPKQESIIQTLVQSDAHDTRLNALWDMLEKTETAYVGKLSLMAPYDLPAYHEMMNPSEPPAKHHMLMCEELMKVESGETSTLVMSLPPGAAKALALDTPIPTPTGWSTMGELRVGDEVFDENGQICNIIRVSPIWKDRPVYKIRTDCGDEIVADEDHQWLACSPRKEKPHKYRIYESKEIAESRSKRLMIRRAGALDTPHADLPINPYLLGLWLGDGDSFDRRITCHPDDQVWIREHLQYPRIPDIYMRSSPQQRLSLLQGLIVSSSTICRTLGRCTFCNTNLELAQQCRELVRSLGKRARWRKDVGVLAAHKTTYTVTFYHEEAAQTLNTYVEAIPCGVADTVCIEVDSDSHMFLCGESMTPTHNSTYGSRSFVQWMLGRQPDHRILAVGHALALDTIVPTPAGFKTIEQIHVGDLVFGADGAPVKVMGKSPVFTGRECFEVTTSTGQQITCDGEHLWTVDDGRHVLPQRTDRLCSLKENSRGFQLPKAGCAQHLDSALSIDPYTLGLWLGDGESSHGGISTEAGDRLEISSYIPYEVRPSKADKHRFTVLGLKRKLIDAGLYNNKRIPLEYIFTNKEDRERLLQGLMDSDGSVTPDGDCCFHNTNKQLIDGVRILLFSMGVKNTLFDEPGNALHRPAWRVHFRYTRSFRLKRKASHTRPAAKGGISIKIRRANSVPVQCIRVDNTDGLFLITESYVVTHNSQKFAEDEFSKPNRAAINSDLFRLAFPDVELNPNEKGSAFWKLHGWRGSYACRGALAGVAGLRAHLLIGDDPYKNAQDALSPTIRDNIWRWWTSDLMSRRLPGAPLVLIETRWHSEDVAGNLDRMNQEEPESIPQPAVIINIPAQAEVNDPLGRKEGEWLWEDFYGAQHYETLRATMPASLWSALYLGRPVDTQGEYIAENDFHRYKRPPINRKDHTPEWTKTVMSVDTASKGNERSDYTVMMTFRVHVDGTHYLVDVWRGKENLEQVIHKMSKIMRHWQVNYAIIEDSGMGMQILENYAAKMPAPLVKYTPSGKGSKDFRFDAATPWITTGRVLFPEQAPWLANCINEMVAFPNASHDDQADAFSQYTDHELKVRIGGTRKLTMGY